MQGLSPIQNKKKRSFNMDLGPDSAEEEEEVVVKKKIKNTEEFAESVSELIKIDTKNQKKRRRKQIIKKQLLNIQVYWIENKGKVVI